MKNILIINICKEKLHYYEFVKPIEDILDSINEKYFTKNYKEINKKDLEKASHVIICGTSLFDNKFINDISDFSWIINYEKPILGICGGMQIIGLIYGGKLKRKTEIGFYFENFNKEFFGIVGENQVYHLHNNYIDFYRLKDFEIFSKSKISQAVKHRKKNIYGVLFHPEVRQKEIIIFF
ncbi:MAG: gamma-glutamyl-gamma-aminobutyrate hydrolase family protein [Nanoarchaeota archaeon]